MVKELIDYTLDYFYKDYYNTESLDYLKNDYHSIENIIHDIQQENVYILCYSNKIIGTGTIENNYIKRLFVLKDFQKKGYGTYIMNFLEQTILKNGYNEIILDALVISKDFFTKIGYLTINEKVWVVKSGKDFKYFEMKKIK